MIQRSLNLKISQRTTLVSVDTVRAVRGIDAESVFAGVDSGEFKWAWNIGTSGEIAELRFLAAEIDAETRDAVRKLELHQVIDAIVPSSRDWFHRADIQQLLLVSHQTVLRLASELSAARLGVSWRYPRAALVRFFEKRWEGHPTLHVVNLGAPTTKEEA